MKAPAGCRRNGPRRRPACSRALPQMPPPESSRCRDNRTIDCRADARTPWRGAQPWRARQVGGRTFGAPAGLPGRPVVKRGAKEGTVAGQCDLGNERGAGLRQAPGARRAPSGEEVRPSICLFGPRPASGQGRRAHRNRLTGVGETSRMLVSHAPGRTGVRCKKQQTRHHR